MNSPRSYILGFILSIVLTMIAFGLIELHIYTGHVYPTHEALMTAFIVLAVVQLIVQLVFFLHVGRESKPKWKLTALVFALLIIFLFVGGTLWIMNNVRHDNPQMFVGGVISPEAQAN